MKVRVFECSIFLLWFLLQIASLGVQGNLPLTQVSSDPYVLPPGQHRTEVEPDTFQFGNTVVSTFQVGRAFSGGATNIGFATSLDGGLTWPHAGMMPGITIAEGGPYERVTDPVVAYDRRHNVWLISSLALTANNAISDVLTSRSLDGGITWSGPILTSSGVLDKNWIVCDNTPNSTFYGTCYTQYDIISGNQMRMTRSRDGGLTWGPDLAPNGMATGLGGQPLVRPDGIVVVPYWASVEQQIRSFRSLDGGKTWQSSVLISPLLQHTPCGNVRQAPLPSADVDAAGRVYVAWADCKFSPGCARNDIVLVKSTSSVSWGPVTRIPLPEGLAPSGDFFCPGLGVDHTSSGNTAILGVTFYYYTNAACSQATCQLNVGFVSSHDGGVTWNAPVQVAGPMNLLWLPDTSQGRMFGDYISTSVSDGGTRATSVFAVASAPAMGFFQVPMFAPTNGLPI